MSAEHRGFVPQPRTSPENAPHTGGSEGGCPVTGAPAGDATHVPRAAPAVYPAHGRGLRGLANVPVSRLHEGRFGRMFRLPPYLPSDERIAAIAAVMVEATGRPDPALDNPAIPSGYTYLGQFIDHDLTLDTASSLERQNDPDALTNFRSPRFDLDSLYGRGPGDDPFLYDKNSGGEKFLIGHHHDEDDLPRNAQQTALLGDPRNDENTFVGQLHLTMLKFHNAVVDRVRSDPSLRQGSESTFEAAQRLVRWHYQWIVVHDFLRRVVGPETLGAVLDERGREPVVRLRFFRWLREPFIPVEFSVAAYRFGHSMIRGGYVLNSLVGPLPVFTPESVTQNPTGHFGGFRELPPFWTIEWARFFPLPGADLDAVQPSRRIDTRLVPPLAQLPPELANNPSSLIVRNLTRGARLALPSGQAVARAMSADVLDEDELGLPDGGPAPLWYYVLKEAEVRADGEHLGPVGGRIVAEVFLGLLAHDPSSYLRHDPTWRPFLGPEPGVFTMPDLITVSGHGLQPVTAPAQPTQPAPVPGT